MAMIRRLWRSAVDSVHDYVHDVRTALHPPASRVLFQFEDDLDVERFQVTTDTVLGGHSTCVFMLEECGPEGGAAGVFQGLIQAPDYEGRVSKGGFASFRTKPFEKTLDLDVYKALQMTVRTDGRPYIVNIKCADHSPQNLFQGRIVTPPAEWCTVALPFSSFVLTARGTVSLNQAPVSKDCVNGFGVLLADGRDGPFRFEISEVIALRDYEDTEYANVAPRLQAEQAVSEAPALQSGGQEEQAAEADAVEPEPVKPLTDEEYEAQRRAARV